MDDDFIVTTFVVIDKLMAALGHRDHVLAQASDAEVLTVGMRQNLDDGYCRQVPRAA